MRRLRIDAYGTIQFKRQISSSKREFNGQSQVSKSGLDRGGGSRSRSRSRSRSAGRDRAGASDSTQKLPSSDAWSYLKEVKDPFLNQMEKYHMFLDVMTDFKNQRIDAGGVIARVKDLFKGYPSLILGFNTFLPNGNKITFNDDDDDPLTKSIEFEQSISLVKKIKKRFRSADHVYKSFINILGMFRKENKDIKKVYDEIVVLLNGHSDLLDELSKFFPDSATVNPFPLKCFPLGSTIGPHAEIDRNMQHHTDEKKSVHMVKEFGGPHEDMYSTFCEKVKERLRSPGDYRSFLKCLHIYNKGKITRKELQSLVANILGQYPDLMEGFNDFIDRYERVVVLLADESKEVRNEKKCKTEAPTKEAISFLKKVKEHFQNDDHAYQSFLDIIKTYKEPRSIYEVYREVAKLLNDHPDLLSEFTKFLPDS